MKVEIGLQVGHGTERNLTVWPTVILKQRRLDRSPSNDGYSASKFDKGVLLLPTVQQLSRAHLPDQRRYHHVLTSVKRTPFLTPRATLKITFDSSGGLPHLI